MSISTPGGDELRRIALRRPGSGDTGRAVWASADALGRSAWVYASDTGHLAWFDIDTGSGPHQSLTLERQLSQPQWVGDRIVSNGSFAGELLRVYSYPRVHLAAPDGVAGRPLFTGLVSTFARQLNYNRMAVQPHVGKIAVAFKWASRLHVQRAWPRSRCTRPPAV